MRDRLRRQQQHGEGGKRERAECQRAAVDHFRRPGARASAVIGLSAMAWRPQTQRGKRPC